MIYSKFASQNLCDRVVCKKWNNVEQAITSLEEAITCQKQFQTSVTRKSLLLSWRIMTSIVIFWFWIVLIFV